MSELIAASTTDPLSAVRETVGLPAEPTEDEKREADEMQTERRENGHRDPEQSAHYQKRFNKIFAQKSAAERRAEAAEWERDELRQHLAEIEGNVPLDRALDRLARISRTPKSSGTMRIRPATKQQGTQRRPHASSNRQEQP